MNETPDKANGRVERLLRRWGAEEAARATAVGPSPGMPGRRKRHPSPALRWVPVLAAAVVLIAGAAMFVASLGEKSEARRVAESDRGDLDRLKSDLAASQEKLARTEGDLAEARDQLSRETARNGVLEGRAAELQKLLAAKTAELSEVTAALAGFRADLEKKAGELADLSRRISEQQEKVAAADKTLAEAARQREADKLRHAAATEELNRMRDMHARALEAERQVRGELAAQAAKEKSLWADCLAAYLSGAAPREGGLPACQTAARRSRMVQRCAELRREVASEQTLRLLDRLEAILTRLDLMDAYEPRTVKAFSDMVRQGGFLRDIDQVLAAGPTSPEARAWLFEARLILMGAERVG